MVESLRPAHPTESLSDLQNHLRHFLGRAILVAWAKPRGVTLPTLHAEDCALCRDAAAWTQSAFGGTDHTPFTEAPFSEFSIEELGQLFEQTLACWGPKSVSPHKKTETVRNTEGMFFTPPFVTQYLASETLGRTIAEVWKHHFSDGKADLTTWLAYRDALARIRVLDPSCGAGVFLLSAWDNLSQEFARIDRALSDLDVSLSHRDAFSNSRKLLADQLFGIDRNAETIAFARLSLWLKAAIPDLPFTHWDRFLLRGNSVIGDPKIDPFACPFPVSVSESQPVSQRQMDGWPDGFEVILGNPPFVRQEQLSACKDHFRAHYVTYNGRADLFVYFFERGLRMLRPGGRLGFVVSNKWLRAGYAETLRQHLSTTCVVETLVDFGHAPLFPDADAFPCLVTLRKLAPPKNHAVQVAIVPRHVLQTEPLSSCVKQHTFCIPQTELSAAPWLLVPKQERTLLHKLEKGGTPLLQYVGTPPRYGIKTGCNRAFLLSQEIAQKLVAQDAHAEAVLKPILRGQDIKRWVPKWKGIRLLDLSDFSSEQELSDVLPAVYRHVREQLPAPWGATACRKKQRPAWKLASRTDAKGVAKQTLVVPDILWRPDFALAPAGMLASNTAYLVPSSDLWLLACLNSPAMWWYLWRTAQHGKDDVLRMFASFLSTVPIPTPTPAQRESTERAVSECLALHAQKATPDVSHGDLVRRLHLLEQDIAAQVHAAWALTEYDLTLLKTTAPPRMPGQDHGARKNR